MVATREAQKVSFRLALDCEVRLLPWETWRWFCWERDSWWTWKNRAKINGQFVNKFTCTVITTGRSSNMAMLAQYNVSIPRQLFHDLVLYQTRHYVGRRELKSTLYSPIPSLCFNMLLFGVEARACATHSRTGWWRNFCHQRGDRVEASSESSPINSYLLSPCLWTFHWIPPIMPRKSLSNASKEV